MNSNDSTDNSLFYAICYALRYNINKKTKLCSDDNLKNEIESSLFNELFENTEEVKLDLDLTKLLLNK